VPSPEVFAAFALASLIGLWVTAAVTGKRRGAA
jgi:hypothetical protein